jgi:diaminopimelate epimerase
LGADGILRVVAVEAAPEVASLVGGAGDARWFMDYRNADGSIAEMCGNGIRVFARFLVDSGLAAPGEFPVATRAGVRLVRCPASGPISVDMGAAVLPDAGPITVRVGDRSWPATAVLMPNPHAVVFVDELDHAGDLRQPPEVDPPGAFPEGVNVEFVVTRGPGRLALRVHERGSGETRSCGTGVCAAVVAAVLTGRVAPGTCLVDVPGGRLEISGAGSESIWMTGPAVLVATGWWGVDNDSLAGSSACDAVVGPQVVGTGRV